jgi:CHAT domain-containing protein
MSSGTRTLLEAAAEAERLWKGGAPEAAFTGYRLALQARLHAADQITSADLVAIERFADLAVLLGYTDAAQQSLTVMAELCAAANNEYGEDFAILKAVLATHAGGRLDTALALLYSRGARFGDLDAIRFEPQELRQWEQTVQWPSTDDDDRAVLFAMFYLASSRLAASLGQYGDAMQAARRGQVHARQRTPLARRYQSPLLLAQTVAMVQSGQLAAGANLLKQLGTQLDAQRDPGLHFEFLELSAKHAMLAGEFGIALNHLQHAVAAAASWAASVQIACLQNLAELQILLNQTAKAEQTLARAAALIAPSDAGAAARLSRLRSMAEMRARSYAEDSSSSISLLWGVSTVNAVSPAGGLETTAPANEQPVDFLAWFEQRMLQVQLALGDGQPQFARQLLDAVDRTFAGTDSELVGSRRRYYHALLAYYDRHYVRAGDLIAQLLPTLERAGLRHDAWQARRLATWVARRAHRPRIAIAQAIADENQALAALADTLDPVERAIFLLNKWTAEEQAIAGLADRAIAAQQRQRSWFAPLNYWRTLVCWRTTLALETRLNSAERNVATATDAPRLRDTAVGLLDLCWRQPREQACVTFSALPDRLIAIVRTRGRVRVAALDISRIRLRDSIRQWHERMLQPHNRHTQAPDVVAEALAGVLEDLPASVRDLRLAPDDALHGFPFAALRLKDRFCIERYALAIGARFRRQKTDHGHREAVVIAASEPIGDYSGLPQATKEAATVGQLLTKVGFDVRLLSGAAVRQADAAAAFAGAAVVHVACHGRFQPDQPSETGLVLAGDDGSIATLSIADITAINASRLRHVTLSACWSADNYVVPGRWIFSLPEALCRAGAQSVLACLWESDDRTAAAFMQRFYTNLAQLSRAEAVREAQLACLRNQLEPGIDTSDPVFWAGFYLFGDAERLQCA